jgi:hypothetical protein
LNSLAVAFKYAAPTRLKLRRRANIFQRLVRCAILYARRIFTEGNKGNKVAVFGLLPEQPKNQGEYHTDKEAGDDGEVEAEVVAFVMDVAGQAAKPAAPEARPKYRADGGDEEAEDDEEFAQIWHLLNELNK